MAKIPKYAQGVPNHLLIRTICRATCGKTRYFKITGNRKTPIGDGRVATCLKCGHEQYDSYNWHR